MNKEYAEGISDLIYLCGCAVREETPDRQRVSQMDLEALYRAAERHMLCSAAAMAQVSRVLERPEEKQRNSTSFPWRR